MDSRGAPAAAALGEPRLLPSYMAAGSSSVCWGQDQDGREEEVVAVSQEEHIRGCCIAYPPSSTTAAEDLAWHQPWTVWLSMVSRLRPPS
jgi:hypothetical protein